MSPTAIGLQQRGLLNVDYPPELRRGVEWAVASWRNFCSLPREVKKAFTYNNEGNLDGSGYELKEEAGATKDRKENFHVTLKASGRLARTASDIISRDAVRFLYDASVLIDLIDPLVLNFAKLVENEFSLPGLVSEVMNGKFNWFLRYLHYFGDSKLGEEIAKAHADKSGFTLHLYESAPGLQYLDLSERTWKEMPVSEGKTAIIPNVQMQFKAQGQLKALCHRVVATEETAKSGRYSMVCFIPLLETPLFNKSGKGRLQDLSPGFNYNLTHEQFAPYFE